MYTNPSEKYYLYTLRTARDNSRYWQLVREYPSKEALINSIADSVNTHGSDLAHRWTSEYFDEINVTGQDTYTWETFHWKTDRFGHRVPFFETHHGLRPYLFCTEDGANVDVRNFKDEIFARVRAKQAKLLPETAYPHIPWRRRSPKSHTCIHYRSDSQLYTRFRNSFVEEYEDDDIYVKFAPKSKDIEAKYKWRDDFWTRGECNWKSHRHQHQWEHRLYRKK